MAANNEWILFIYRLPREPSNPRVVLWRKLRRLGVVQLNDGLVALPADARSKEQMEWLADEVIEAGGEASVWVGYPSSLADEKSLISKMSEAVSNDYKSIVSDAAAALESPSAVRRRTVARLQREYWRIRSRDYFHTDERDKAYLALVELASKENLVVKQ